MGLWAQTTILDPNARPLLALWRWFESLTLTSPVSAPRLTGLWAWLLALGLLLIAAIALQGPRAALRQLLDLRGHFRLLRSATRRLRNAGRLVAILLGGTVFVWTLSQMTEFASETRLESLYVFMQSRGLPEIAAEEATLAAITPFRDLCGLGGTLFFLLPAAIVTFRLSLDHWGSIHDPFAAMAPPPPRWTLFCWGSAWLFAMYRFAGVVVRSGGFPTGGFGLLEVAAVPVLMAMADGLVLACILAELRRGGLSLGDDHARIVDARAAVGIWPLAVASCLLALPSRYVATTGWLLLPYAPGPRASQALSVLLRGEGLIWLQGALMAFAAVMIAIAAWRDTPRRFVARGLHLLRLQGGRLVAWMAVCTAAAGLALGAAYAVLLAMPGQPWLLSAADSYAHYATLAIGLACLAGLVELGGQARPEASPAANLAARVVSVEQPAPAPLDIDSSADPGL